MDERTDALREKALRLLAEGLDVDWDAVKAAGDVWAALQAERDAEAARMFAYVDSQMPRITAELTRDYLRPALAAAGVEDVDKYEVSWVREDGFRPGLFAQEGDGTCAPGNLTPCPPWPDYVYDKTKTWPAELYAPDEFGEAAAEDVKPCRPIYCARHYGDVADAECVGAYQCPES